MLRDIKFHKRTKENACDFVSFSRIGEDGIRRDVITSGIKMWDRNEKLVPGSNVEDATLGSINIQKILENLKVNYPFSTDLIKVLENFCKEDPHIGEYITNCDGFDFYVDSYNDNNTYNCYNCEFNYEKGIPVKSREFFMCTKEELFDAVENGYINEM